MSCIFAPLKQAAIDGGVPMVCADGKARCVVPILAAYVADYPEQCLVSCTKYGTCPRCICRPDEMGSMDAFSDRTYKWTTDILKEAKNNAKSNGAFYNQCLLHGVGSGVFVPFWHDLPFTDIHLSMTSDVLHQLHQGVLKHLVAWVQKVMGEKELDARLRCLPPAFGVTRLPNGITGLQNISGPERKNIAKILLGCLVGKIPAEGLRACKALLDFMHLAQYESHDEITLGYMKDALQVWKENRDYFLRVRVRGDKNDFNIPKFHSLLHYVTCIELFGTTNNYNTELFERLHIEFAKKGWRASNKRDETPQMTTWLERQEKVARFKRHIRKGSEQYQNVKAPKSNRVLPSYISLAKRPTHVNRSFTTVQKDHSCPTLQASLLKFVQDFRLHKKFKDAQRITGFPFQGINIYRQFKLRLVGMQEDDTDEAHTIKATPAQFDTVVVLTRDDAESTGLRGNFNTTSFFCQ